MNTKLHICYIYVSGLGLTHVCSLVGRSVSVSAHGTRLVDAVGLLLGGVNIES